MMENFSTCLDIKDTYYTETKGSNFSTTIGKDPDKGKANIAPMGSTTLGLKSLGEEREQDTKATIGNGSIVIAGKEVNEENNNLDLIRDLNRDKDKSQEITKDMITGALDGSMTVDNRLLFGFIDQNVYERDKDGKVKKDENGKAIVMKDKNGNNVTTNGYKSIVSDFKNFGDNTKKSIIGAGKSANIIVETTYKVGGVIGETIGGETGKAVFDNLLKYTIGTTVGGVASAFGEDSRTENKYIVNNKTYDTWDEAIKDNPGIDTYTMGGVGTGLAGALKNSNDHSDSINRNNETDGLIGDTIEAGITQILGSTKWTSDFSALGRMQAEDLAYVRNTKSDIENYNTHSEGTIGFNVGLQVYINQYGTEEKLKDINYNALGYATWENPTQSRFDRIKTDRSDPNYTVIFDKLDNDPVAGISSPTLKNNLFTVLIKSALKLDPTLGMQDHYLDNSKYDKYFGKTNLVNRQLIDQSRGITDTFQPNNLNNKGVNYVMPKTTGQSK